MKVSPLRKLAPAPMRTMYRPAFNLISLVVVVSIWSLQAMAWALLLTVWLLAHIAAGIFNWLIFPVLAHARYRRAQAKARKIQTRTTIGAAIAAELPAARAVPTRYPQALPAPAAPAVLTTQGEVLAPRGTSELVVGPDGEVTEVIPLSDGSSRLVPKLRAWS